MTSPKIELLLDNPTSDDAFSSTGSIGAHERIATAIFTMIQTHPRGGVIALEGKWGSGKSTVIKILQKKLKSQILAGAFVFDTWAHEGDPLRRSFLENLIAFIQTDEWPGAKSQETTKKLNEITDELSGRVKQITTSANLKPSSTLLTFLSSIAAFSLGNTLLGSLLKELTSSNKTTDPPYTLLLVSILLLLSPAIVIGYLLLSSFSKDNHSSINIWNLLWKESAEKDLKTVNHSIDPTSIEFSSAFKSIANDYIFKDNKKLVVVLDNIDRLDRDTASKFYSTLSPFLDTIHSSLPNTWIILPFDREKLFDQNEHSSEYTNLFLDKLIQVRFHVPPPIISDERNYLTNLLKHSIPSLSNHEAQQAWNAHSNSPNGRPNNPRDIKLYINQICALKLIWKKEIPFNDIALFAAHYRNESRFIQNISAIIRNRSKFPRSTIESFAMMFYGRDREESSELLAREQITESIAATNDSRLQEILSHNTPSFWPCLLHIFINTLQDATFGDACQCICNIYPLLPQCHDEEIKKDIINASESILSRPTNGWSIHPRTLSAIAYASQYICSDSQFNEILDNCQKSIDQATSKHYVPTSIGEKPTTLTPISYITELAITATEIIKTTDAQKKVCIPASGDKAIEAASRIFELSPESISKISFSNELYKAIHLSATNSAITQELVNAIRLNIATPSLPPIASQTWQSIAKRVARDDRPLDSEFDLLLETVLHGVTANIQDAMHAFDQLMSNTLLQRFAASQTSTAFSALCYLLSNPSLNPPLNLESTALNGHNRAIIQMQKAEDFSIEMFSRIKPNILAVPPTVFSKTLEQNPNVKLIIQILSFIEALTHQPDMAG